MIPMNIVGVRVELPANKPIVLLREIGGERFLPIFIGSFEATAIAFALQEIPTARPMTHDLFKDVLEELAVEVKQVLINDLKDETFYAIITMLRNGSRHEVSARPSDAIALAVRMDVPIYVDEDVLEQASIVMDTPEDDEVERFRDFLDHVEPKDFL